MKKKNLFVIAGLFVAFGYLPAQTPDPFGDVLRRMNDQMLRGLPPADSTLMQSRIFTFPADTSFFFQFDTTFSDGSRHFYFHFSPGQNQSGPLPDPFGLDQMMREFFGPGMGFDHPFFRPDTLQTPRDDGDLRQKGDLLPEEKLRQQETPAAQPGQQKQAPSPKPKTKPKVDDTPTIRI